MAGRTLTSGITDAQLAEALSNLSAREDAHEYDLTCAISQRDVDTIVWCYDRLAEVRDATARLVALRLALNALTDADVDELNLVARA